MSRVTAEIQKKAHMYTYLRVERPKNNAVKWTESEAWGTGASTGYFPSRTGV